MVTMAQTWIMTRKKVKTPKSWRCSNQRFRSENKPKRKPKTGEKANKAERHETIGKLFFLACLTHCTVWHKVRRARHPLASSSTTATACILQFKTKILTMSSTTTDFATAEELDSQPPFYPAKHGCRSVEEFQCINRVEEGTYGVVYRAKDKRTGETVALKRLKIEKEKEGFPITSLREISTLLKANHENIVAVREVVVGSNMDKIYLVMDFVEHDLKSLMETMKQPFLLGEVKTLMLQLLRAVAHLHDNWILHRDLKTSNLLLSHSGILKVSLKPNKRISFIAIVSRWAISGWHVNTAPHWRATPRWWWHSGIVLPSYFFRPRNILSPSTIGLWAVFSVN